MKRLVSLAMFLLLMPTMIFALSDKEMRKNYDEALKQIKVAQYCVSLCSNQAITHQIEKQEKALHYYQKAISNFQMIINSVDPMNAKKNLNGIKILKINVITTKIPANSNVMH